ncbi:GRDP2-like protein [Mya arenaria]|uniref:GRDP2-like protein n=1 Tax=Mya arenaria TaxID=6604 RepID=A0ABY7FTV5_MYAAR|nr:uncharacterized protein LOC128216789 [Mya arenaria]WAR25640.1 GRDP2-like protein [Mya arenaria]
MDWMDVEFSVDLVKAALDHLNFLDHVDNFEKVLSDEVLQHGLRRYEQLWLPLADTHRGVPLVAPVDVAWFWYLHLLQPLAYRRDCRKLLNATLDHQFPDKQTIIPHMNNAIEVWYSTYPKEGFNIIRNGVYIKPRRSVGQVEMDKPSKLTVDLLTNASSHMYFCYQVALPHFRDQKYLENALNRYKQFLRLKRLEPNEFLTPSVDILLLWYTHMCNPIAYATDMMKICGKILDNNVKVKPGEINDRFILARERTNDLWKKVSNEELIQPGTQLRPSDLRKDVLPMTLNDLKESCVMTYKIYLSHAELHNPSSKDKRCNLELSQINKDGTLEELVSLHSSSHMWTFSKSFMYNTIQHRGLKVVLSRRNKFWCYGSKLLLAEGTINMKHEMECMLPSERALAIGMTLSAGDGQSEVSLGFDGAVDEPIPVLCDLVLRKESFIKKTMHGKSFKQTWGQSDTDRSHTSYTADHKLVNHEGKHLFTCRVTHVPEMLHSGVEIYFRNKLVSSSRLIGSSQLPGSGQIAVREMTMSFDPELGERAMLIRYHAGDWGLCVARWRQGSPGETEGLEVRFMKLVDGKTKVQRLDMTATDVKFQSFNADVYSGALRVNPAGNTVAENMALFWCICVLYVLCRPGNADRQILLAKEEVKQDAGESEDEETSQKAVYVQENVCQFLLAAGLTTESPSNRYMRERFGSLTSDLLDAYDVIVVEQKSSKRLIKHESIISMDDVEGVTSVRKSKKKKKHLKTKDSNVSENVAIGGDEEVEKEGENKETIAVKDDHVQIQGGSKTTGKTRPVNVVKPKLKQRKSSQLDDMLVMSDDSITKDDVIEVKLVKDEKGRKKVVKKMSSGLSETVKPDDSLDEEERERQAFFEGLENKVDDNTNTALDIPTITKEETKIIKEVVERRKREHRISESERGMTEVENDRMNARSKSRVSFQVGGIEGEQTGSMGSVDEKSDTSSTAKEGKALRKRISQERENMYPLTDEDIEDKKGRRKRKKSKQKLMPANDEETI